MKKTRVRWLLAGAAASCLVSAVVPTAAAAHPDKAYPKGKPTVIHTTHSNMCLGVSRGSKSNGAQVGQGPCNGRSSQVWNVLHLSTFVVTIQNANSGKCMDVKGRSAANGARIVQYNCVASTNQMFVLHPDGVVNTAISDNEKCLDIAKGSRAPGAPLDQFTCNGQPNQHFRFAPV